MSNILIRADGSGNIGLGHIIRCLSLGNELQAHGNQVAFITKYKEGQIKITENEFSAYMIFDDVKVERNTYMYGEMSDLNGEIYEIYKVIDSFNADIIIVDSYNISSAYLEALRKKIWVIYIDDIDAFTYPVDAVINGNINATHLKYRHYDVSQKLMLGVEYNMIRKEFCNLPHRKLHNEVKQIMITTGGADPLGMTYKIANWILNSKELTDVRLNIVIGSAFSNIKEIVELQKDRSNIFLYHNPEKISDIMIQSDIAISSGGSTLYELCACGTPSLSIIFADNQVGLVTEMDRLHLINSLGWYHSLDEHLFDNMIINLINDFETRQQMSQLGQKLVDGNGCKRIVERLFENMQNEVHKNEQ